MVKLITFLLAFSLSAFAEDYQIFDSLEGDLEVNKIISSKFKEKKWVKEIERDLCSGDYKVIKEENPNHFNFQSGCFDENSIVQTVVFKKFDAPLSEGSFLVPKKNPIFTFDNLEIIWDEGNREKFITIDIRSSIKQIYTKYSSNIERFIEARSTRLKNFKLLDKHSNIFNTFSSRSSYCIASEEGHEWRSQICAPSYKYYYSSKNVKNNSEIKLNKNYSEIAIEYEIHINNDISFESYYNPEGSYLVSFEDWWDAATEKKIKVSVRCLNCIDKQFKTKEIVVRNYFPKKALKDGGGLDETDSLKEEYGYENDFYRKGINQEEKNKYNKQDDLIKTPIKEISEQERSEKIEALMKQCKKIGHVPGSKKFKDCVLELL